LTLAIFGDRKTSHPVVSAGGVILIEGRMFEHKRDKLLPWPRFVGRMALTFLVALGVIGGALGIGILGYHYIVRLAWIDALLNASMILTGMGPVATMEDTPSKLFASAYALFSGVIFLSSVGIVLSPVFHRILHKFHLDTGDEGEDSK
jgi:hypothetical protein